MTTHCEETGSRSQRCVQTLFGLALAMMIPVLAAGAKAQTAGTKPADSKPAETRTPETYQTIYLTNGNQQSDANDIQTDLRDMLPKAKMHYVPQGSAISIRGTADDIALAQKIISEIDRPRKTYRLTYSITEMDGSKRIGTQHIALVVVAGSKTYFKQGSKVPIVTGATESGASTSNTQVQYMDIGLGIEAWLEGALLHTKVEQSSLADEKSGIGSQDPVIRQTVLDDVSTLQVKPLVLGSLDIPGTTRRQEIEVVSEAVL
jgi:type II secretory pathway component GspD/PulD (secretin)